MARNKYPEETVQKIIEVSMKLFLEKGYDHTTMQDIVKELGGLSKGAIYHHFKTKQDILLAVMEKMYEGQGDEWTVIRELDQGSASGLEKLRRVFTASIENKQQDQLFGMAPSFLQNPQMLAMQLQGIYEESAPYYLQPIIEQGVQDGSIDTKYPKELAEVLLLVVNLWLAPLTHVDGGAGLQGRIGFFQEMMQKLGLPIVDEAFYQRLNEMAALYDEKGKQHTP